MRLQEELEKYKQLLLSVDKKKCLQYALKYSKKEFDAFPGESGHLGSGDLKYICDGVSVTKYGFIEEGVQRYLSNDVFQEEREMIELLFGEHCDEDPRTEMLFVDGLPEAIEEVAKEIFKDKIFDEYRLDYIDEKD